MNLFQTAAAPEPLSLLTMLGGGLLAFVSPCVLPMLPVYAMYLMGGEKERGTRLLVLRRCLGLLAGFVLLFTLMGAGAGALGGMLKNMDRGTWLVVLRRCLGLLMGFVLLFTLMGAGAGALGSALKNMDRGVLNTVTGVLMIVFGLWMLDVFHLTTGMPGWLGRFQPAMTGFWGSFAFGLLIAVSWTPCLTPVLANALMLAASQVNATMWTGIVSLAVFAVGLCLPMLAVMLFYQWLKGALGWLRNHQSIIRKAAGVLMIAYGFYLIIW